MSMGARPDCIRESYPIDRPGFRWIVSQPVVSSVGTHGCVLGLRVGKGTSPCVAEGADTGSAPVGADGLAGVALAGAAGRTFGAVGAAWDRPGGGCAAALPEAGATDAGCAAGVTGCGEGVPWLVPAAAAPFVPATAPAAVDRSCAR